MEKLEGSKKENEALSLKLDARDQKILGLHDIVQRLREDLHAAELEMEVRKVVTNNLMEENWRDVRWGFPEFLKDAMLIGTTRIMIATERKKHERNNVTVEEVSEDAHSVSGGNGIITSASVWF